MIKKKIVIIGCGFIGFIYARVLKKLNCEVPETLLLKLIMYKEHMAEGDSKTHTFSEQEWEIPPTRSPHAKAVQWACDYILVENNDEKIL